MTETDALCRHPDDKAGCRERLIAAYRRGVLAGHCIMAGLRANLSACREMLLAGLGLDGSTGHANDGNGPNDLPAACRQVVLEGYPLGIEALRQTFY